ncbi:MAG: hypothetical protein LAT75_11210 [Candidatus Cyclonatronum sp.]|uniref:hypothetical protein n=1 Tax=Cyclonatronum sp. TaxID=3024185 RepID=UPI0025C20091|nr:hypothetical protein [Cyclonatronum sp.]MCC5933786.1 hypothetical protein [Balneolales bacterium]MCH8487424.1 hypothetical protein [Cyclonatronum sp.]
MRTILAVAGLLAGILFLASCDAGFDGNFNENQPPRTFLTVNEINLPEGTRLTSQINISWWGDDPDGYIVGYEFRIGDDDEQPWVFTTRTDSLFVLPIEEGNTDADVRFTVRAVDNEGAVDPEPPNLVFPIRNSPPNIRFRALETPPDSTFRVFSFGWQASDPDGDANLNRIEMAINDTTSWQSVPPDVSFITVRVDDTVSPVTSQVFLGRALNSSDLSFDTINLNADNTFYIRAVDNAGALSEVVSYEWYIKQQTSRVLVLNDIQGDTNFQIVQQHFDLLRNVGINQFDFMDITDGVTTGGRRVVLSRAFPDRSLGNPTINLMLAEWDHIYWVSNNLDRNVGYALELTVRFFENGGTMFINIPTRDLPADNPLFQFLPFQRMEVLPSGQQSFFIANNSLIEPTEFVSNPPFLQFRRNLLSYYPLIPFGETVPLFEADFKTRAAVTGFINDFGGSKLISATNPDESILYFGVDLREFTADSELTRLIEITCIEILGFQQ